MNQFYYIIISELPENFKSNSFFSFEDLKEESENIVINLVKDVINEITETSTFYINSDLTCSLLEDGKKCDETKLMNLFENNFLEETDFEIKKEEFVNKIKNNGYIILTLEYESEETPWEYEFSKIANILNFNFKVIGEYENFGLILQEYYSEGAMGEGFLPDYDNEFIYNLNNNIYDICLQENLK